MAFGTLDNFFSYKFVDWDKWSGGSEIDSKFKVFYLLEWFVMSFVLVGSVFLFYW